MEAAGLVMRLLVGGVAGWLAGNILRGGYGLMANIILGMAGACVGRPVCGLLGTAAGGLTGPLCGVLARWWLARGMKKAPYGAFLLVT